jgi:AcrR family transcriptional regulator
MTPRTADDVDLRENLLAAASRLLATEGAGALTVRRIAHEAGCSTMGVYTHFGAKDGVVEGLFVEGFDGLGAAMAAVRTTASPLADLRRCGQAYRSFALANPTHYAVMFERVIPGFVPSEAAVEQAHATLGQLETRVARCLDAGVFSDGHGDAVEVAHGIWATVHGLVLLELHGLGRPGVGSARRFDATLAALVAGLAT